MTSNVGSQDCRGRNVGDGDQEEKGGGQAQQLAVVDGAVKDEDPGGVEEEIHHQQDEEGVGEDERIIEQSRQIDATIIST